jgi:hypothetical protein
LQRRQVLGKEVLYDVYSGEADIIQKLYSETKITAKGVALGGAKSCSGVNINTDVSE